MMSEEDFVGAITELKRCQKTAAKYRHFSCVAALTYKLLETLENTDSQLDRILAQVRNKRLILESFIINMCLFNLFPYLISVKTFIYYLLIGTHNTSIKNIIKTI